MTKCNCVQKHCFYNSIKFAFGGLQPCADNWANPLTMKKWLKILPAEQVLIENIPTVETKIKVSISVEGMYDSEQKYPKRIMLKYEDGHYSLVNKFRQKKYKQGKRFALYFRNPANRDYILVYDGENLTEDHEMRAEELGQSDEYYYKEFSLVKHPRKSELNALKKEERWDEYVNLLEKLMVENYNLFIASCNQLAAQGINLAEHGYSKKATAQYIFSKFSKATDFSDWVGDEQQWYLNCKNCGLIYAEPKMGHFKCIDANSFYPSVMRDSKLIVPLGNPEFFTLEKIDDIVKFGIYRCVIKGYDRKIFMHNPQHYYTYTDVKFALRQKYSVELVQDGKPNFMFYSCEHRDSGFSIFRGFVDTLYALKKLNPLAKQLLNILWGSMCEKEKIYLHGDCNFTDDSFKICGEGDIFVEKVSTEYKLPSARVGVFITAFGRCKLAEFISDFKDDVYRIHTDGVYVLGDSRQFEFSEDLGKFKLESEGNYEIVNCNLITKLT